MYFLQQFYSIFFITYDRDLRVIKMVGIIYILIYTQMQTNVFLGASEQGQPLIYGLLHILSCWTCQQRVTSPATPPKTSVQFKLCDLLNILIRCVSPCKLSYITIRGKTPPPEFIISIAHLNIIYIFSHFFRIQNQK